MSWNILPTFRLKITQYSMEDTGIHGDFPTFTLTKITQISTIMEGPVWYTIYHHLLSKGFLQPPLFSSTYQWEKDGKRTSMDFHLPCSIPGSAIPTVCQIRLFGGARSLAANWCPIPDTMCAAVLVSRWPKMSSMISWCHDAGNCCHVLTEKIMGKFMGKYRNLWENVGKYPINGGFELGNRTHRIFKPAEDRRLCLVGKMMMIQWRNVKHLTQSAK